MGCGRIGRGFLLVCSSAPLLLTLACSGVLLGTSIPELGAGGRGGGWGQRCVSCSMGHRHPAPARMTVSTQYPSARQHHPWLAPDPTARAEPFGPETERVTIFGGHCKHTGRWVVLCKWPGILAWMSPHSWGAHRHVSEEVANSSPHWKDVEKEEWHQVRCWVTGSGAVLLKGDSIVSFFKQRKWKETLAGRGGHRDGGVARWGPVPTAKKPG